MRSLPQKPDTSILVGDIRRIEDVLNEKRAQYGKEIVVTLARQLVTEYGNGYSKG